MIKQQLISFKKDHFYLFRGVTSHLDRVIVSKLKKNKSYDISNYKLQKNSIMKEISFTSFSLNPMTALSFNWHSPCCLFRLKITQQSIQKMHFIIYNLHETEVLFSPFQFKVIKKTVIPNVTEQLLKPKTNISNHLK